MNKVNMMIFGESSTSKNPHRDGSVEHFLWDQWAASARKAQSCSSLAQRYQAEHDASMIFANSLADAIEKLTGKKP